MRGLLLFGPRSGPGSRGLRVLNRIRRARGDLGVTDSEPQAKGTSNEECGTPFSTGIAGSTGTTLVHCTLREVQVFVCLIHQSSGLSGARLLHAVARAEARGRSGNMAPARHADVVQRAPAGEPARGSLGAWRVPTRSTKVITESPGSLALYRPTVRPTRYPPISQRAHDADHRGHPFQQRSRPGMSTRATAPTTDRKRSTRECPCMPTQQGKCQTLSPCRARGSPPRRRGRATTGRSGSRARSAAADVAGGVRRDAGRREVRRRDPHVGAPQARDRQAAPRDGADLVA